MMVGPIWEAGGYPKLCWAVWKPRSKLAYDNRVRGRDDSGAARRGWPCIMYLQRGRRGHLFMLMERNTGGLVGLAHFRGN